ncbi:hypothetical protein L218DRAFT_403498 [Marasmius fiardii PR-910]|nr:hypothetical protein L218DRAFT_403498 [Marasmius fiardii PR-910]
MLFQLVTTKHIVKMEIAFGMPSCICYMMCIIYLIHIPPLLIVQPPCRSTCSFCEIQRKSYGTASMKPWSVVRKMCHFFKVKAER